MARSAPAPAARPEPRGPATRDRLLEAAAQVFAEAGFEAATVREVCRRAGANVAAVNYHFGSKQRLYRDTLLWAVRLNQASAADGLAPADATSGAEPGERLEAVVRGLAAAMLAPRPEWHRRLLLRELASPSPALLEVLTDGIGPTLTVLEQAVRPCLPGATPRALRLAVMSIVGQVLYHRVAAPVALRLLEVPAYDEALVAEIARHIAAFTRRALAGAPVPAPAGVRRSRR